MSTSTSSHAYGIGVITLIVAMSAVIVFYTNFYLPESLAKPSVSHDILDAEPYEISIVPGAVLDDGNDYEKKHAKVTLGFNNKVVWTNNDDTGHTVTPMHRYEDFYSGEFGSSGIINPSDTYEFLFTNPSEIEYRCMPHPWMTGSITVEERRF